MSRPIETASIKVNSIGVMPEINQEDNNTILEEYHLKLGHGTADNMSFLLSKKYKWAGMHKDIHEYVKKCIICLKCGEERVNTKNNIVITTRPNEMWEVDVVGYFKESQRGFKFILVAIDHYSKWVETKAIKSKDMNSVINAIKEIIIEKHGIPERTYSDNGLEFANTTAEKLAKDY